MLATRCDCTHFAPGQETARILWIAPPGKRVTAVRIDITDRNGVRVFQKTMDDPAVRRFDWDGEDNSPLEGVAAKRYVNPLRSPFAIRVQARLVDAAPAPQAPPGISASREPTVLPCGRVRPPPPQRRPPSIPIDDVGNASVKVLYRGIALEKLEWLDAYKAASEQGSADFPGGAGDDVKRMWLAYRLNEVGFPAGPISDMAPDPPILRALFRYAQSHPELPHLHEYETIPNFTWEEAWEAEYGDVEAILAGTKPSGRKLLDALKARENPCADVVETPAALSDRTASSRVILDHDIFYANKDFSKADGHADYDKELFNPIVLAFRAKVLLVSREDADATGPGIESPGAVGAAPIEWLVFDPPADLSQVPTATKANNDYRTQARIYLKKVLEDTAADYGDPVDAQDNCPVAYGGARPSYYKDVSAYFQPVQKMSEASSTNLGRVYTTKPNVDPANPRGLLGLSGVFFTGSYIAGDDYVIQARLSFDNVVGGDAIKADHQALAGLRDSFGPPRRWMEGAPRDPVVEQTGHLTIWRRNHIAAEVEWGPNALPAINWFPIIDCFRAAHIILVPPPDDASQAADLFDDSRAAIGQAVVDAAIAANAGATKTELEARRGEATCRTDGMYPVPLRTLVDFERSPLAKPPLPGTAAARFARYTAYLTEQNSGWPTYQAMVGVALALRKALDKKKKGPGLIVMRTQYMPKPTWATLLPPDVLRATTAAQADFAYTKAMATGMDYGVVFLDSLNGAKYADIFFVTHELSHCLFGSHAFEEVSYGDHDRTDRNCIMYYGSKNAGFALGWGARSVPDTYTLRLELKRNDKSKPLPDSLGRLEGLTAVDGKPREYTVKGSASAIQAALRGAKFKPERSLGDEYKVDVEVEGAGTDTFPSMTPPLKAKFTMRTGDGTVKPFRDVVVTAADPKAVEPRFCGKCLLKLRGWRVRDQVGGPPAPDPRPLAAKSPVIPVNPVMTFEGYELVEGSYVSESSGAQVAVQLAEGRKDPLDERITLGPAAFLHNHKLRWEASNGRLADLATVKTREWVKYRTATQEAPFCDYADPDQEFVQYGSNGDVGFATDEHSIGWPALVVASPINLGGIVGEQWYQYKLPDGDWTNIEGAAFLLEKTVYFNGSEYVLKFKKSNWAPHNTKPFVFEVHYKIGTAPSSRPKIAPYTYAGATPAAPRRTGNGAAEIRQCGARTAGKTRGNRISVSFADLKRKGYIASEPWT